MWDGFASMDATAKPATLTNGSLYSLWITDDPAGASHGYVAAGGPNYPGVRDELRWSTAFKLFLKTRGLYFRRRAA